MTTETAFQEMINVRGIFHVLGLAKGTVSKMRSDLKTGHAQISLDKKIELLKKAGYEVKQEMMWKEPKNSLKE